MTKNEAFNSIENAKSLEEKFNAAFNVLKHSPSIAQDKMLLLYAYFKQSTLGDFTIDNSPVGISNYIQTFKNNARIQLIGMSKEEAMKKYIELTILVVESDY